MATFVVSLGFTPDQYYRLTVAERNAIIQETNRRNKQRKH